MKRKRRTGTALAAVLGAMLLTLAASAGTAQAATTFVGPGESIQAAVDAASPGDTILVSGVHHENVAITKDGLRLRGLDGATLLPPATPTENACFDPSSPEDVSGFCVIGDVDFDTGEVIRPVRNVTIRDFLVSGFSDSGILGLGMQNATFVNNVATDNAEYGITAFVSSGTHMEFNRVRGSGEAGFYIGDSPNADVTLIRNDSSDNLFGFLLRNAERGSIGGNVSHDNCVGLLVLADEPGPAGIFRITNNFFDHNTKACPASEDTDFPISGVGVALFGSNRVELASNQISGNLPSGETAFSGGVVVFSGFGGTPPTDNHVVANRIQHNAPDILWDGTGTGNDFTNNLCQTSVPAGLC